MSVGLPFDVQLGRQGLSADYVAQGKLRRSGRAKPQDDERPGDQRRLPVERQNSQVNIRQFSHFDQMTQLFSHYRRIPNPPQQDRFVHYYRKLEDWRTSQPLLAAHSDLQVTLMYAWRNVTYHRLVSIIQLLYVILSLQNTRDDIGLPVKARYCLRFQTDELQVLWRQYIGVILPPASLDSVLSELKQPPAQGIGYAVIVDQLLDFHGREALAARLRAA